VAVASADCKSDRPLPKPSGLALNAEELAAIIDCKVIPSVFPKGRQDRESSLSKGNHHCEGRPVADVLWVVHRNHLAAGLGWAVSKTDNKKFAYDDGAPE
jgi:hypothetical protein